MEARYLPPLPGHRRPPRIRVIGALGEALPPGWCSDYSVGPLVMADYEVTEVTVATLRLCGVVFHPSDFEGIQKHLLQEDICT